MNKDCYGWDEELGICLIYGIYCNKKKTNPCYHANAKEMRKQIKKDLENDQS